MKKTRTKTLLAMILLLAACRQVPTYDIAAPKGDTLKENIISANRIISKTEGQQIDAWLSRRGWQMETLSSGVRVAEIGSCDSPLGAAIGFEDTVDVVYNVLTLGGDTIYARRSEQVVTGHLKPTRGLDVALRTLHEGSQALVIVPSEQAYGVVGDGNRIRSRMVLVYDLRVEGVSHLKE